jgi:hypothetical protein
VADDRTGHQTTKSVIPGFWDHALRTDDQARDFARILIQNFKNGGQYTGAAQMAVKNDQEGSIASFQFQ